MINAALNEIYTLVNGNNSGKEIEIRFLGLVQMINNNNDKFWKTLSTNKDVLSYRFEQRRFPESGGATPANKEELDDVKPARVKIGIPVSRISDYQIKTGILRNINGNYIDEGSGSYKSLDAIEYYSLCGRDVLRNIFQQLARKKLKKCQRALFAVLASSREYCHMVMDAQILRNVSFNNILYHSLFYGLYLLYREECTQRTLIDESSRCVWSLENACTLPSYAGSLETSPYYPLTLNYDWKNKLLIPLKGEWGLYSPTSFRERFRIFTDGIFENMNMSGIVFTGSVIPACAIRNPLEGLFDIYLSRNLGSANTIPAEIAYWEKNRNAVNNYFEEYYPSRAVLATQNMDRYEGLPSDLDIIIEESDNDAFDNRVYSILQHLRRKFAPLKPGDLRLYRISGLNSYKYTIMGNKLKRNLEIFRMFLPRAIAGVSRFHFPAVRGIYNGRKVYLTTSMVCYAYSGVFPDYKWMSSVKEAKDLILKYYARGGTALLNERENADLIAYVAGQPKWRSLTWAGITVNHPIFKPRQMREGLYYELNKYKEVIAGDPYAFVPEVHTTCKELKKRYASGHIIPIHFWQILKYL